MLTIDSSRTALSARTLRSSARLSARLSIGEILRRCLQPRTTESGTKKVSSDSSASSSSLSMTATHSFLALAAVPARPKKGDRYSPVEAFEGQGEQACSKAAPWKACGARVGTQHRGCVPGAKKAASADDLRWTLCSQGSARCARPYVSMSHASDRHSRDGSRGRLRKRIAKYVKPPASAT